MDSQLKIKECEPKKAKKAKKAKRADEAHEPCAAGNANVRADPMIEPTGAPVTPHNSSRDDWFFQRPPPTMLRYSDKYTSFVQS
jgi:hypothetical protein